MYTPSDISPDSFDRFIDNDFPMVVLVYSRTCPHCITFLKEWNSFYKHAPKYAKNKQDNSTPIIVSVEAPELTKISSVVRQPNQNPEKFKRSFPFVPSVVGISKDNTMHTYDRHSSDSQSLDEFLATIKQLNQIHPTRKQRKIKIKTKRQQNQKAQTRKRKIKRRKKDIKIKS